jgi:hypothetical protein
LPDERRCVQYDFSDDDEPSDERSHAHVTLLSRISCCQL